jgi:hypothetical protein
VGGETDGGTDKLSFVLPSFPMSFNQLYTIDYGRRLFRLSDTALLWKTRTIPFVKPCRWPSEWLLRLTLEYQSPNWYYLNGKLRRLDVQNLEKLVIDTLFAKWDFDDSQITEKITSKCYGPREQIVVTLERSDAILREVPPDGL